MGWLHVVSDVATWGAYMAIPLALVFVVTRRRDLPFPAIFWLFGAFIFACGTGHLIEAIIFWWPVYNLAGVTKLGTAIVSWATVAALVPLLPRVLALPGLEEANERLRREIRERETARLALETANAKLAAQQAEMEQFIHSVSHDLKSPIFTLSGMVGFLKRDIAEGRRDRLDEIVSTMDGATKRMRDAIDDLLELSRVGHVALEFEPVDLAAAAREAVENQRHRADQAGCSILVREPMPTVTADRKRVVQLLDNLVGNAVKYGCTPADDPIEIGCRTVAGEHRLYVRDKGRGIPARHHERIFRLFARLESDIDGSGVGLAIVKRIADVHAWRVWVESAEGEGATFWVAIPADDATHTTPGEA